MRADESETIQRLLGNPRKFYPAVHARLMREGTAQSRLDLLRMLETGIADGLFTGSFTSIWPLRCFITRLRPSPSARTSCCPRVTEREAFVQIISNFFRGISTAGAGAHRRLPETL